MGAGRLAWIGVVYARQDDDRVEGLLNALRTAGLPVRRRRLLGLPGKTVDPQEHKLDGSVVTLVVWTPWLRCSDWAFSSEAMALLERPDSQVIVVRTLDESGRPACTDYGASPMAGCEMLAPLKPDASGIPSLVRVLVRRAAGRRPKRVRRGDPGRCFEVASPDLELLGERLAGLYALARGGGTIRGLKPQISRSLHAFSSGRLRVGDFLAEGSIRLVGHAGNGPLAAVWRAWDHSTESLVAVRVLHDQWAGDPGRVKRFFGSADALAGFDHPAIARLQAPGRVERGFPFYVRDWFSQSLHQAVSDGSITPLGALQAVLEVASALAQVHADGGVHGNLKPDNILLDPTGRAYLTDFLADPMQHGDPVYVAPEVQDGAQSLSAAADVYSVAMCVLYALHGSALPFWVLRDPLKLVDTLQLDLPDGPLPLPVSARGALLGALEWSLQRTNSIHAFLDGFFEEGAVTDALRSHAEQTGRHRIAAAYLEAVLQRSDGRPLDRVFSLGRTWAGAATAGDADAIDAARTLLLEVLERSTDLEMVDGAVDLLRALVCNPDEAHALADTLHDDEGPSSRSVALLVHAARIRQDLDDPALAAATWHEVAERHLHRSQATEAYGHLVEAARVDTDRAAFFEVGCTAFHHLDSMARPELAYELGVTAQDELQNLPGALQWLECAQRLGHPAIDIPTRLEAIRSARGEWRQVVALMLERAERLDDEAASIDLLVRAARVAVHAHNHHDEAASILLRVLLVDPEHREALRFLARYHARAGRDERALALYARLAPHEERGREGETVAIRVADNVDYARVLLRCDRPRGAQLCLEAALDLNPFHVPTLELTSQLAFDLGKWDEARVAHQGLVSTFGSATAGLVLINAHVRLGDIAWLHGDLLGAVEQFNAALELDASDARVWWGKAKVALAGLHGRLDPAFRAEEPWLLAAPIRFTALEALARLLGALVRPEAVNSWFSLDPMGREVVALVGAQHHLVQMCAAVDLMVTRQLIQPVFFERLSEAHPGWADAIEVVRRLWFDPTAGAGFDPMSTYAWDEDDGDFDSGHHREVIALEHIDPTEPVRPSLMALHAPSAWRCLFDGADRCRRVPPVPQVVSQALRTGQTGRLEVLPGTVDRRSIRVERAIVVGSGLDDDLSLIAPGLKPRHAVVERLAGCFYVRAEAGEVFVDGVQHAERRLLGGERLEFGGAHGVFHVVIPGESPVLRPVERPDMGLKPDSPDPIERTERAALFYREGGIDRIVPLATDAIVLWEADGELRSRPGHPQSGEVGLTSDGGMYWFHEPNVEPVLLEHRDEMVVGRWVLQFKELGRHGAAPLADIAALWGAPEDAPILVYDDGSRHGRPIVLDRPTFRVGRGRQADFQVSFDTSLSRTHCIFFLRGDVVMVRDAGSANGTQVNGQLIEAEVTLVDGDTVQAGQSRFQFRRTSNGEFSTIRESDGFSTDDATEVLPVSERVRSPLGLDEGLEKIRVTNRVLTVALRALDAASSERGADLLKNLVAARPRSYQGLLDGVVVQNDTLPGLEVMFNVAQRPESEQRPLLNSVLQDVIERVVEVVCSEVTDAQIEPTLLEISKTRYREILRI